MHSTFASDNEFYLQTMNESIFIFKGAQEAAPRRTLMGCGMPKRNKDLGLQNTQDQDHQLS